MAQANSTRVAKIIFTILTGGLGFNTQASGVEVKLNQVACQQLLALDTDLKTPYETFDSQVEGLKTLSEQSQALKNLSPNQQKMWAIAAFNASYSAHQRTSPEFLFRFLGFSLRSLGPISQSTTSELPLRVRMQLLKLHLEMNRGQDSASLRSTYYDFLDLLRHLGSTAQSIPEALTALRLWRVFQIPFEQVITSSHHMLAGIFLPFLNSPHRLLLLEALTQNLSRLPTLEEFKMARAQEANFAHRNGEFSSPSETHPGHNSAAFWAHQKSLRSNVPLTTYAGAIYFRQKQKARIYEVFEKALRTPPPVTLSPFDYDFGLFSQ